MRTNVAIRNDLHTELSLEAVRRKKSIQEMADEAISQWVKSIARKGSKTTVQASAT